MFSPVRRQKIAHERPNSQVVQFRKFQAFLRFSHPLGRAVSLYALKRSFTSQLALKNIREKASGTLLKISENGHFGRLFEGVGSPFFSTKVALASLKPDKNI
jgi:hypothetical protein